MALALDRPLPYQRGPMTTAKTESTSARKKSPRNEPSASASEGVVDAAAKEESAAEVPMEAEAHVTSATEATDEAAEEAANEASAAEAKDEKDESSKEEPASGRDRIQQQLELLKQREAELRRELAMADHPELADAIRQIEGRAYGVARVEAKMAQGLSKSELRKKETLEKKLAVAEERRAEIDLQIAALKSELAPLGEARVQAFQNERAEALLRLLALLGEHEAAIAAANLDLPLLVPSLATWRTELDALRTLT
jgi:hypothetical protein